MATPVTNPALAGTDPAAARLLPAWGLCRYIEEVAEALGLPADGVGYEVSDTATGYLALAARHPAYPDRDLMLTWQDSDGWSLATEPSTPTEPTALIAHLTGDVVPTPQTVARFTDHALTSQHHRLVPSFTAPPPAGSGSLAHRLAAYHHPRTHQ